MIRKIASQRRTRVRRFAALPGALGFDCRESNLRRAGPSRINHSAIRQFREKHIRTIQITSG